MKRVHASAARAACVCWAITSDTRIAHGSEVSRNASGRAVRAYQSRTSRRRRVRARASGTRTRATNERYGRPRGGLGLRARPLVDELDHPAKDFGIGRRQDAVAEVEDVARPAGGAGQDMADLSLDLVPRPQQDIRVEV